MYQSPEPVYWNSYNYLTDNYRPTLNRNRSNEMAKSRFLSNMLILHIMIFWSSTIYAAKFNKELNQNCFFIEDIVLENGDIFLNKLSLLNFDLTNLFNITKQSMIRKEAKKNLEIEKFNHIPFSLIERYNRKKEWARPIKRDSILIPIVK